jgi:hypothetical protein
MTSRPKNKSHITRHVGESGFRVQLSAPDCHRRYPPSPALRSLKKIALHEKEGTKKCTVHVYSTPFFFKKENKENDLLSLPLRYFYNNKQNIS